jgi:hypothetical protein
VRKLKEIERGKVWIRKECRDGRAGRRRGQGK